MKLQTYLETIMMVKLLVVLSMFLSEVTAYGEEFIRRLEEIIEHENNTLEQTQKLVELETVFAYGEKFRFQDKMVDLSKYYNGGNGATASPFYWIWIK